MKSLEKTLKSLSENPRYILDADYIIASMGLLSEIDPLLALKIMKKHLKEVK